MEENIEDEYNDSENCKETMMKINLSVNYDKEFGSNRNLKPWSLEISSFLLFILPYSVNSKKQKKKKKKKKKTPSRMSIIYSSPKARTQWRRWYFISTQYKLIFEIKKKTTTDCLL